MDISVNNLMGLAADYLNLMAPVIGAMFGIGLFLHLYKFVRNVLNNPQDEWISERDRQIQEWEVENALAIVDQYEKQKNDDKPKNDWRLGDDGEMVEIVPSEFFSSNER